MKTSIIRRGAAIALSLLMVVPIEHASAQAVQSANFRTGLKRNPLLPWWFDEENALPGRARQFYSPEATNGPSIWLGGVGVWSNGAMWSPAGAPNAADADVFLDGGNTGTASAVTLVGGFTVGRLTIDAGDSLAINDNSTLSVATGAFVGSGTILNNGNIMLNSAGNLSDLNLNGGSVALNGTGTVTLGGNAANRILNGTLTIGAGQTIQGGGSFGSNSATIINNGTILANSGTLRVDPESVNGLTNNSFMRASGGTLELSGSGGGTFFNTGTIEALAGSQVQLTNGATVSGGILSTTGDGTIQGISVTLTNVTNNGSFVVGDNRTTFLTGTLTNNGNVALNSAGNLSDLNLSGGSVTITGTGTVTLGGNAANRILNGTLTIGAAQTIQGGGSVGSNSTTIINNGTILANSGTLRVDPESVNGLTNNSFMRASGGTLELSGNGGGTFFNTGTIEALAASQVQLTNGAILSGGILSTTGDGTIQGISGTLTNVTNNGSFVVGDNRTIFLTGTLTNNGNVALSSIGNSSILDLNGGSVALNGTGTVTLGGNAANRILNGTLTIGAGQTIQGGGSLGVNATTIINNGIILATAGNLLTLDPDNTAGGLTNNNILRATGGGTLRLTGSSGAFTNSASGVIEAQTGSEVQLAAGASISGGTLTTAGTGVIRELTSQDVTISNLTNAGTFVVNDNSVLRTNGTITNNGSLTLASAGNVSEIRVDSDTLFGGSGTVTLSGSFNARVSSVTAGARLTIGANQTFNGMGQIGLHTLAVTNLGLIDANLGAGRVLEIDSVSAANGFLNQATMQASNGGVLRFTGNGGGDVNNAGGIIQAVGTGSMGEASEVQFTNLASVTGGTLTTAGGGIVRVNSSTQATISNLINAGTFIVNDNSILHVNGTITNNGTLTLNSLGNSTDLAVDSDTTLTGSGTVFMAGSLNARVRAGVAGTRLTIGPNQIFSGRGQIGFNDLALTNLGLIDANLVGGQVLQIDAVNVADGFLNQATMQASNGGVLVITGSGGGDINNTGGVIQAVGAGSEVQLTSGGSVSGGTLTTSTGGVVRVNGSQQVTISNLANAGTFVVNDNSILHTVGTITNNGTMMLSSAGNFTDLALDGDVIFAGTGSVTLANSNNARVRANTGTSHLTNSAGHTFNGRGQFGLNTLLITNAGTIDANVSGLTLTIDPANAAGAFLNDTPGTVRASGGGTASLTGSNGGDFTNNGIFEALNASALTMDASAVLTNNMSGVLTLGSYRAFASGGGATLTIRGSNITQLAANTEVILSGAGSIFQVGSTALESTLLTNNGALRILANRNYTNTNALTDNGVIELGGGIFNAPGLTIGLSGELFGFGTVSVRPDNSGLVRATGGTLDLTNGLGSAGTAQSDLTGILDLSGSATASSANFLFNNGNLALGGQNFVVSLDYNNANFGVGNSFDPRAHVTGAGMINAAGNVGQTLSGAGVANGSTATPLMAFGNVHVGDAPTRNYQINNTGTNGPSIRGALQTSAKGGNITDGRLIGSGVTASNFGPISLGGNSGTFGVTFNATAAGALTSQLLHIINNFDNVAEQNLSITGAAFRYANPTAHTPEPIAFGNFHVGDMVTSVFLSLTNNVPNDSFSEALNAMIGGATGGVITNGGMINLLAPGATNNNTLSIGLNTTNAGNQSGTATITLQSDGTGSSGLGITNLPSQIVNVTGSVYRYASPTVHIPEPVVLANQHVGDSLAQALSITNGATADGFSEALNASITGTSGSVTGSGFFTLLGAGLTNNSSLSVGVDTSVAGVRGGTATIGLVSNGTGTSGLGLTNLMSQTVNVSGSVYRYANPTVHTPEPVNFGVVHVGDSVSNVFVSLTNNVPADGFSESLNASIGGASAGLTTNSGSFTGLAAGSTNSSSLSVGVNTGTAGSRNGTATVTLQSNGAGSSGLGTTNLPSQTVNVTGQVNYFADPALSVQSGAGTLSMDSPNVFTLDLGQIGQNSGMINTLLALQNLLHDATFQDSLGGTFDLSSVNDFLLTGFDTFSGILSGAGINPSVAFNSAMAVGNYTDTLFLTPTSTNASGTSNLPQVQLNLHAEIVVVPEPGTWAMMLAGVSALFAMQRPRRRRS